jgi:hypothetical protein
MHKLWYCRNRNSREEKTFQKRKVGKGEEAVAGNAPSDRSLTSGAQVGSGRKGGNRGARYPTALAIRSWNWRRKKERCATKRRGQRCVHGVGRQLRAQTAAHIGGSMDDGPSVPIFGCCLFNSFFFELAFFISFYSKQPRRKRKEARTGEVARGPRQGAAVCCAQAVGWIPISIRISFFSHSFLILAKLGILFCIKNLYSCSWHCAC